MAATAKQVKRVSLEDVRIIWTNFEGEVGGTGKGKYNKYLSARDDDGSPIPQRTLNIVLTQELADQLREMGAKIRTSMPQHEDQEPMYTLTAFIGKIYPDTIWRIIPAGKMALNRDTIGCLDHERIDKANVDINLVYWENDTGSGWKAWVRNLACWIHEDEFAKSLSDIPTIGSSGEHPMDDDEDDLPF